MHYFFKSLVDADDPSNAQSIRFAIGQSISLARQNAGMTQEQVAERLGIGPEAVSRLERGIGSVTAERLVVLADMFKCRSDQLLLGVSPRVEDQGAVFSQLLDGLEAEDRAYVIDNARRLAEHLRSKTAKPTSRKKSR